VVSAFMIAINELTDLKCNKRQILEPLIILISPMDYIDNRNWPEYNAQLVRRGEFYLDLSCVKNWSWELRGHCLKCYCRVIN